MEPLSPCTPPTEPTPSTLERLLDTGLLSRAAEQMTARLRVHPQQPALLRRLGDVSRQIGDIPRAVQAYTQLLALQPDDVVTRRLLALLAGERLPPPLATWPAQYVLYHNFLSLERLQEVQEFTSQHQQAFRPSLVHANGENVLRPEVRRCMNIWEIDAIRTWLEPLVFERFPEVIERLQVMPFKAEIRDCKLTHYGDGNFFRLHIDRAYGCENRMFGFIYYFYFPPKRFTGGGLAVYDLDLHTGTAADICTTLLPEQNQLVFLSSTCWHEVLPVRCDPEDWHAGRFTLNGWICRVD